MDLFYEHFTSFYQAPIKKVKKCCKGQNHARDEATPLPKGKLFVVISVLFVNVFGATMIFPFLPFMVHDFFPNLSKEEIGQKAGFLGSAYYMGSFAGSLMWGWISDVWGRRPTMLLGLCGTLTAELLFGFSQNFAWAISARFLWGLLNGNVGVAKTYLSEILDDTNQARGFSMIGIASGIGRLTGALVGGFLAQPASKYSLFQHEFFCTHRYALPVLVAVGITSISLVAAFLFLEETLRKRKNVGPSNESHDLESDVQNSDTDTDIEMVSLTSESETESANHIAESDEENQSDFTDSVDTEPLLRNGVSVTIQQPPISKRMHLKIKSLDPIAAGKKLLQIQKEQCIECCYCCPGIGEGSVSLRGCNPSGVGEILKKIGRKFLLMFRLMMDRRVIVSTLLYAFIGGTVVTANEVFPLLMVTDHKHGGYDMDDNEIGVFIMVAGVFQLIFQLFLYPRLIKIFGYRHILRISVLVFGCGVFLIPWANTITGPIIDVSSVILGSGSSSGDEWSNVTNYCGFDSREEAVNENSIKRLPASVWAAVLIPVLMFLVARVSTFTTIMVMVNNSAVQKTRGTVNGIGQSLVAILRSFGPTAGSLLFAWSETTGRSWPINYHLVFDLCLISTISIALFSFCLPKTIEKKRV